MKKLFMIFTLASMFILGVVLFVSAEGLGSYSTGYRFGMLDKGGLKKGFIGQTSSWEGQMLLGYRSTPITVQTVKGINKKDGAIKLDTTVINPWMFSSVAANKNVHMMLDKAMGEYCVIRYKQSHIKFPNVDTEYEVEEVYPLSENKLTQAVQSEDFDKVYGNDNDAGSFTQKSKSKIVGRFIKISEKGRAVNSTEVTFQQGGEGSQFVSMSVRNSNVSAAIKTALFAGQRVKIYYVQNYFNLDIVNRETGYDIVKVEPAKEAVLD